MSEEVKQIYDAWGNRASIMKPDSAGNGERLFKVGGNRISVPDDPTQPAKVSSLYNKWGAQENPMPNMSFSEGEMRIPVEDFVDLILRRVPAEELAEGLWRDEEVRKRFIYCMVHTYAGSLEDKDRREALDGMQVAIYAKAIDRAIERLNDVESGLRAKSNWSRWEQAQLGHYGGLHKKYLEVLEELEDAGKIDGEQLRSRMSCVITPDQLKEYVDQGTDPVTKESVGKQWYESRDFWRQKLMEKFPEPAPTPYPSNPRV